MRKQSTSCVLMRKPDHFGFNSQTAVSNPFQHAPKTLDKNSQEIRVAAQTEFSNMVKKLQENGVEVLLLPSPADVITPDAVFPNNWFSTHQDGKLVFYPFLTPNRRLERQKEALVALLKKAGVTKPEIIDLTKDEEKGMILESTGSMIFDRVHKVSFAMASGRTVKEEFEKWCKIMDYEGVYINSTQHHKGEVYHTNINFCIGTSFAVICSEVIEDKKEREAVLKKLENLGKEVIEISLEQVYQFCGNILELQTPEGEKLIVMSQTARKGFTKEQKNRLEEHGKIVAFTIPVIEEIGGGGVRCMIAEIFPPDN